MRTVIRWGLAVVLGLVVVTLGVRFGIEMFLGDVARSINHSTTTTTTAEPLAVQPVQPIPLAPMDTPVPTFPTTTTIACPPGQDPENTRSTDPPPWPSPSDHHWVYSQQPSYCFGWTLEPN